MMSILAVMAGCVTPASQGNSVLRKKFFVSSPVALPQLCVLGLGPLQDGEVRVGILPVCEQGLVGRAALGGVSLHSVCAGQTQLRHGQYRAQRCHSAMRQNRAEFPGCISGTSEAKVGQRAEV